MQTGYLDTIIKIELVIVLAHRNSGPYRCCTWFVNLGAVLIRTVLSDTQWDRIKGLVPGKESDRGVTGRNNRLFVESVLWVARRGAPWRDLPAEVGAWNSTFRRFSRWSKAGVWESLFKALADDPDFEYVMLDSTIVRAHQHAAGAKGGLRIRPSGARAGG